MIADEIIKIDMDNPWKIYGDVDEVCVCKIMDMSCSRGEER
jgi:hypothetical protein